MNKISLHKLNSKEIGYIFGLFEGDGYAYHDKKNRHYAVDFYLHSTRDLDIIKFLIKLLKKIGCNPHIYQDKRYNCIRIRVKSKLFSEFIVRRKETFDKDFILGFVSGLIDADGYVNFRKSYIQIINTDEALLIRTQKMLKFIGLSSSLRKKSISKKDKKSSYNLFITFKFVLMDSISLKVKRRKTPDLSGD